RNILLELKKEEPELFTDEIIEIFRSMIRRGVEEEIKWARYVIGENIKGLTMGMIEDYLKYLGNLRCRGLGFDIIYEGYEHEPESMSWVSAYADPNAIKTDFFEAKPSAYSKSSVIEDDL
ncbi:MAG: ribonucleotide-diphosphate reductase subunit beta, partial [Bacillota bacterium]|nr:ribonucleotide-diphosphate reductase subunit beta [Bacillota bacterium]